MNTLTDQGRALIGTATYSPDDNKIRITPFERLERADYEILRAAGFIWAPGQKIYIAPMWTPERYALAVSLCGDVGDDDTSLTERAEDRAERFSGHAETKAEEAARAAEHAAELPTMATGSNYRQAARTEKKIKQAYAHAVNLWETSEYWTRRAAGALRHAKYVERADVRARRIKTIEAAKRKAEREEENAQRFLSLWGSKGDGITHADAMAIANYDHVSRCFPLADYPRTPPVSQYEGAMGLWSALDGHVITAAQARDLAMVAHIATIGTCAQWIAHYENRLAYERAMLNEQGAASLLDKKPRTAKQTLPICNYEQAEGWNIASLYHRGEMEHYPCERMTKVEYAAIYSDDKGTRIVGNSHRVRVATIARGRRVAVFLTDSKVTTPPAPVVVEPITPSAAEMQQRANELQARNNQRAQAEAAAAPFKAMKEALRAGIPVAVSDQLFPTPRELAERMAKILGVEPGHRVLEPEAGTGLLLGAVGCGMFEGVMTDARPYIERDQLHAVEINAKLAERLAVDYPLTKIHCADFMEWEGAGLFDRIIMNPPFANAADIKHIKRAAEMLAPGGRLVAICANGPRQNEALRPLATYWEELPAGTFAQAGTGVNTVLLIIENGEG